MKRFAMGQDFWAVVVLAIAAARSLPAADALPKAETILDKYVEVTGGKAAYAKLHTEIATGVMDFAAMGLKVDERVTVRSSAGEMTEILVREADIRAGNAAMEEIIRRVGEIPVVVITAFGSLDVAVAAMRAGAVDYLTKPFELDDAAALFRRVLGKSQRKARSASDNHSEADLGLRLLLCEDAVEAARLAAPLDAVNRVLGEFNRRYLLRG